MWSKIDVSVSFLFWRLIKLKAQKWKVVLFLGQELLSNLIPLPTTGGMKMNRVGNSFLPGVFNIHFMSRRQKRKGQWKCRCKSSLFRSEDGGFRVRASVRPAPSLKAMNRELFTFPFLSYSRKILNVKHFLACQMFLSQIWVCLSFPVFS